MKESRLQTFSSSKQNLFLFCSLFIFYLLVFNRHAKETRMAGPRDQWKWRKRTDDFNRLAAHVSFLLIQSPGQLMMKGNGDWIRKKHAAGGWQAVTFSFLMSSPAHRLIHDMKENANVSRMTSTKEKVGLPKKSCRANRRAADQRPRRRCPTVDKDFFVTPLIKLDDQSRKAP